MRTLRAWRIARLMSVRDLATKAGVSTKTVTELEYGRQRPTFVTMRKIAAALGVEPTEIEEFAVAMEQWGKDAA